MEWSIEDQANGAPDSSHGAGVVVDSPGYRNCERILGARTFVALAACDDCAAGRRKAVVIYCQLHFACEQIRRLFAPVGLG
jgi:hypothetical protein